MSLTIQQIIGLESDRDMLDECSIKLTKDIRELTVYHHEWAKERDHDSTIICVMFAGNKNNGAIMAQ